MTDPASRGAPETLTDEDAVRLAYSGEIQEAAQLLESGVSVLVTCDKLIAGHAGEAMMRACGRLAGWARLSDDHPGGADGGPCYPQAQLGRLRELLDRDPGGPGVFALAHLDLMADESGLAPPGAAGELAALLNGAPDRILLAFADPSLPVPGPVAGRFGAHLTLYGLPREIRDPDDGSVRPLAEALLTAAEAAHFTGLDSTLLHRHVAGLSPVRFRQAIVAALRQNPEPTPADVLYQAIRWFKAASDMSGLLEVPTVTFADIGGYADVKDELRRRLPALAGEQPASSPLAWLRGELAAQALLLHGPPGVGKRLFSTAVASALAAQLMLLSGDELTGRTEAETAGNIAQVYAVARRNAPAVLVLDDLDAIGMRRDWVRPEPEPEPDGVAALIAELARPAGYAPVITIGNTNRLDIIHPALLVPTRFRAIAIDRPDATARAAILQIFARWGDIPVSPELADHLVRLTEGLSGDEIRGIFVTARADGVIDGRAVGPHDLGEAADRIVGQVRGREQARRLR